MLLPLANAAQVLKLLLLYVNIQFNMSLLVVLTSAEHIFHGNADWMRHGSHGTGK